MLTLGVVIATKGRPNATRHVVESLAVALDAGDRLVVIDQSPDMGGLAHACDDLQVSYVPFTDGGLPAARNKGVAALDTDIVLFVDDDIVPRPGLLQAHREAYDDPTVGGVGGRILERVLRPNSDVNENRVGWDGRIRTRLDGLSAGTLATLKGCHMSFRRTLWVQVGGADEGFAGTFYYEDADVSTRIRQLGYRLLYQPSACVEHLSLPAGGVRSVTPRGAMIWRARNSGRFLAKHRGWVAVMAALPVWIAMGALRGAQWRAPYLAWGIPVAFVEGAGGAFASR